MPLLHARALTLDFTVDTDDPDLLRALKHVLAGLPSARTTPATRYLAVRGDSGYELTCGSEALSTAATIGELLDALVSHLNLTANNAAHGRLLLHAGAVASDDGRLVVLPGPSGSGKSTLTAALVGVGMAYVTDETLCVEPDSLAVVPYPKPLTLKAGSFPALDYLDPGYAAGNEPWQVSARDLGGRELPDEARLRAALVVAPTYVGAGGTTAVPMSRAAAVFMLATNTSALGAIRSRPLEMVTRFLGDAQAYRMRYDDVERARDLVLELLGAP